MYVMKRLRFLGNKTASQLGALMFLALWHGLFTGYFLAFAMEFADMIIEVPPPPPRSPVWQVSHRSGRRRRQGGEGGRLTGFL